MNLVDIKDYIIENSNLIQGSSSIVTALLAVIMLFIAIRALKTYKSQILFELEIEAKAYALRSFEIYLKFNQFEFHEHLLKGEFLEKYNARIDFYGSEYVNANNETLIRRYCFEQLEKELASEIKDINIIAFSVISTLQNRRKYKAIYRYYFTYLTFYHLYRKNIIELTAFKIERFNEIDSEKIIQLDIKINSLEHYLSYEQCQLRNDEIQELMEKATKIE